MNIPRIRFSFMSWGRNNKKLCRIQKHHKPLSQQSAGKKGRLKHKTLKSLCQAILQGNQHPNINITLTFKNPSLHFKLTVTLNIDVFRPITLCYVRFCPPATVAELLMYTALPRDGPVRCRGHKHHFLLSSVTKKMSQRSCDAFTLAADLCASRACHVPPEPL